MNEDRTSDLSNAVVLSADGVVVRVHVQLTSHTFHQQLFDDVFDRPVSGGTFPVQLTLPPVSNVSVLIDDIDGRPHGVAPRSPVL